MRRLSVLVAAAAAGSCTAVPPQPVRTAQAETQYQQLLAGKVALAPVSCMSTHGYRDMIVIDENTIAFRAGANRVYITHMRSGCSGLSRAGSYALVTRQVGTSGYCEGDIASVVDTLNRFTVASCIFGDFTPYVRAR